MKKHTLALIILLLFTGLFACVSAVEIKVEGKGKSLLSGYDIKDVRNKQDEKMYDKSQNADNGLIQKQQINGAAKQAELRKNQDEKMSNAVRRAVVTEAQDNALKAALSILIDRTLGAGASKNPQVQEKFEELLSQSSTYILDQNYTGEIEDNYYVAKAFLNVDETAFRGLVSDMGIALNTQKVRQSAVLLIVDEFFAAPSDLKSSAPTKDVTTYSYNKNEQLKDKESYKASSSAKDGASYVSYYGGARESSSAKSAENYGHYTDYSNKENEFFQHVVEYQPKTPKVQNLNYTQPALQKAFTEYDVRSIDNDMFKSKYFKGNSLTADKLSNSAELANYVNFARKDAKADFFAVGVSYITDNGKNPNTGMNTCDGNVFVKIYSTQDGEVIASGSFTESAAGNSPDQARVQVANKIGNELGEELSKKIQDYWKRRTMYGSEYVVLVKGNFLPMERITINKAIQSTEGIQNVSLRTSSNTQCEFLVNYKGMDAVGDAIFMSVYGTPLSSKFNNYDYSTNGNQIIFSPVPKSIPNL